MAHHAHAHHKHLREGRRVRNAQQEVRRQVTEYSVVYVTASKTFNGPVGGYKTMDGSDEEHTPPKQSAAPANAPFSQAEAAPPVIAQSTPKAAPLPSPETQHAPAPAPVAQPHTTQQQQQPQPVETRASPTLAKASKARATSQVPAPVASASHSHRKADSSAHKTLSKTLSETLVPAHPAKSSSPTSLHEPTAVSSVNAQPAGASSAASSAPSKLSSSGGMSGGAKAGLAIGILLAIAAVAGLIFFCFRRRRDYRNEAYSKTADEKAGFASEGAAGGLARSASVQTSTTSATAPRLSLRPVTQFLPDLAAQRKSGNLLNAPASQPRANPPTSNDAMTGKVAPESYSKESVNPFSNDAEMSEKLPIQSNAEDPANPFGIAAETSRQLTSGSAEPDVVPPAPLRIRTPTPDGKSVAAGFGTGIATAGVASAVANENHHAPKPLNLSPSRSASPAMQDRDIPSPAGTEFSMTPVSPGSFTNGPPPSNVHRIQLDFKPSMDDELELRAGQLVRLLHEYDDGWALCIRLDRSQQGVAPRTCLSARPVKPRPPPGARGPAPRGPPPPGMFPGQQRPASPANGRGSPSPFPQALRPGSPNPAPYQRSMSPGPYGGGPQRPTIPPPGGKARSNSASAVRDRRNSPPGPSPMNPNVQRVPMHLQAVTAPGQVLSQSPPQSVARKPVPGQAM